ncbi:MAG: hypothetical protein HQL24_07010 [Candidatus Omnitrophica bacterium]|nr:hypothetical protein [Candidatus Omnitrophota bacterium]
MNTSKRNLAIELFKGLGVVYMLIGHQIVWLFTKFDGNGLLYPDSYKAFAFFRTGLHPLVLQFPALAGASLFFLMKSREISLNGALKRAGILIFMGFLLNLLAWGPYGMFAWDVLPFIGLCTVISYPFIRNFDKTQYQIMLLFIGLFCLSLSNIFPWATYGELYLYKIFLGDSTGQNYWPFCPWYSLFVSGIFLAHVLNSKNEILLKRTILIGAALLASYIVSLFIHPSTYFTETYNFNSAWGVAIFKPSLVFTVGIIGFGLTFVPLTSLLLTRSHFFKNILQNSFLTVYARGVLWIYFMTIILGYQITSYINTNFNLNFQKANTLLPFLILFQFLLAYLIGKMASFKRKIQYE